MLVPVVYSVAKKYPDVRFTVLSKPFARPFFEGMAPNVFFMEADVKGEYKGIHGLNVLYRRLLAKNFTAIADVHDVLRTKYLRLRFFLTLVGKVKVAHINKHRAARRRLCDFRKKELRQLPTSFENYSDVLARIGYPVKLDFDGLYKRGTADLSDLPTVINTPRKDGEKWIGIAPFAAHQWKVYPLSRMEKTIELLLNDYPDARIFFFGGGKDEMEQFGKWCGRFPQCTNASAVCGGIANELKLMNHLDVMLSMDSGNMHMAAIAGCPVVSVWGATHPFAGFAPWGQDASDEVQTDLPCRPCSVYGNKECARGDFACMYGIKPETVAKAVERHLGANE